MGYFTMDCDVYAVGDDKEPRAMERGKKMSIEKIAEIIYEELPYMYCDNCRYATEITEDPNTDFFPCESCYRKYNGWGISMSEAKRIADMINTACLE